MLKTLEFLSAFFAGKDAKEERGSEAIQFILLAVILGVGLIVVFAFIRDKAKTAGSGVGNCIQNGSTATGSAC